MENKYQKRPTQEQRILDFLIERGEEGVFAWELTNVDIMRERGGATLQYNARIYGLRKKGYIIKNKQPGHFVLIRPEPIKPEQRSLAL